MKHFPDTFAPGQALFYNARNAHWLHFIEPLELVTATDPSQVIPCLRFIEQQVEETGLAAAGWVSYEAAPAFDDSLAVHPDSSDFPLLWFGLYNQPEILPKLPQTHRPLPEFNWSPTVSQKEYVAALDRIKEYIACGDTYQVNYTYRRHATSRTNLEQLLPFINQPPPFYGGIIADERWTVASGSPELFFTLDNESIVSRPMKGTIPRGLSLKQDLAQQETLYHSVKDRAENVMIVDMVRNDIGRIAVPGSVRVPELFTLEQYPTLHQLTSTVEAETKSSYSEVFQALFPPASITGAPKKRTMEIIRELETTPRRVYTGTMGFMLPGRKAQFNVAIRTLLMDHDASSIEYGVGSGIVWDSDPEQEFRECATKTMICRPAPPPFSLLETMRWTPEDGIAYFEEHLQRLVGSARYFAIPLDRTAVEEQLNALVQTFESRDHKVRLLVDQSGQLNLEHSILNQEQTGAVPKVALASHPIEDSTFLYHKTTNRQVYQEAIPRVSPVDDTLLYNQRGELTESTIANIILVMGSTWYTPPVRCGLLPGTAREHLIASGKLVEKVLPVSLLKKDHTLLLVNSVRGVYPVDFVGSAPSP